MESILNMAIGACMFWYNYYLGRLTYKVIDFMFNAEVPTIKKPKLVIIEKNKYYNPETRLYKDEEDFIDNYEREEALANAISSVEEVEIIEETKNNTNNFSPPIKQEYGLVHSSRGSNSDISSYVFRNKRKESQIICIQ